MTAKAYFNNIEFEIKQALSSAKSSIRICVAWLNTDIYGSVLMEALSRNVAVFGIFNDDQSNQRINLNAFTETRFLRSYMTNGIMHNKFCVIDEEILISGSYNWSKNARNHHESIEIKREEYSIIKDYMHEFSDLWDLDLDWKYHKCAEQLLQCGFPDYHLNGKSCGAPVINVLITSAVEIDSYKVGVWRVCQENGHSELVFDYIETDFNSVNDIEEVLEEQEREFSKQEMLAKFYQERSLINKNKSYIYGREKHAIHALAYINVANENNVIEYDEDEEYELKLYWKCLLHRKTLPDTIGDIDPIVRWSKSKI